MNTQNLTPKDNRLIQMSYLGMESLYHAVNATADDYAIVLVNAKGIIIYERSGGHFTAELGNQYPELIRVANEKLASDSQARDHFLVSNHFVAIESHRNWHTIGHAIQSSAGELDAVICIISKEEQPVNNGLILDPMVLCIEESWRQLERSTYNASPKKKFNQKLNSIEDIVGKSPEILHIKKQIAKASNVNYTVLVLGKSGTGKEMVAQAIHSAGRPNGPFVAINCGASSKELLRSELFGYEEGAFTGAKKGGQIGKIMQANHGTLFLDEIGEMSLDMQVLLLRFLETGVVTPVGSLNSYPVDVRIIAATNKDLLQDVLSHKFRDDLYFRLNVIKIVMPPLMQRSEDIPMLVRYFLNEIAKEQAEEEIFISDEAVELLKNYYWPGNVRQLKNALEQAYCNSTYNVITEETLPSSIRENINYCEASSGSMQEHEKRAIENCLGRNSNNITKTAKELGISRATLYNKIAKMGISL